MSIAISDHDLMKLTELQREIVKHGTEPASFRARWEFGRLVLQLDEGLPACKQHGTLIAKRLSILQSEVSRRKTFASKFSVESALANWSGWSAMQKLNAQHTDSISKSSTVTCIADQHVASKSATSSDKKPRDGQLNAIIGAELLAQVKDASGSDGASAWLRKVLPAALEHKQAYDEELRAIKDQLSNLRKEIQRVRINNKIERSRRRVNPLTIDAWELKQILDFAEEELDKISTGALSNNAAATVTRSSRPKIVDDTNRGNASDKEQYHDHEEGSTSSTLDASFGGQVCSDDSATGGALHQDSTH
jgi:hypothetical protein